MEKIVEIVKAIRGGLRRDPAVADKRGVDPGSTDTGSDLPCTNLIEDKVVSFHEQAKTHMDELATCPIAANCFSMPNKHTPSHLVRADERDVDVADVCRDETARPPKDDISGELSQLESSPRLRRLQRLDDDFHHISSSLARDHLRQDCFWTETADLNEFTLSPRRESLEEHTLSTVECFPLDALVQPAASLGGDELSTRRESTIRDSESESREFALQGAGMQDSGDQKIAPSSPTKLRPSRNANGSPSAQRDWQKLEQVECAPWQATAVTCEELEKHDIVQASADVDSDSDSDAENPSDSPFATFTETYARVRRWRCELCNKQFYLESQQRAHFAQHIECPEPACTFSASKRIVASHRADRHGCSGTYSCNACGVAGHSIYCCSKKLTRMELIAQRQVMFKEKSKIWRCQPCKAEFFKESQLVSHCSDHVKCTEPTCEFSAVKSVVAKHRATAHNKSKAA